MIKIITVTLVSFLSFSLLAKDIDNKQIEDAKKQALQFCKLAIENISDLDDKEKALSECECGVNSTDYQKAAELLANNDQSLLENYLIEIKEKCSK